MLRTEAKNIVVKVDKEIVKLTSGVHYPAFDSDTEVTVEKVFDVHTAAPGVVGFKVAVL